MQCFVEVHVLANNLTVFRRLRLMIAWLGACLDGHLKLSSVMGSQVMRLELNLTVSIHGSSKELPCAPVSEPRVAGRRCCHAGGDLCRNPASGLMVPEPGTLVPRQEQEEMSALVQPEARALARHVLQDAAVLQAAGWLWLAPRSLLHQLKM